MVSIAAYYSRKIGTHLTDKQLADMAQGCRNYVDLMQDSMPHECQLAMRFDWIRAHLFALHD